MAVISDRDALVGVLATGQFDRLVGVRETDWLEFKEQGYPATRKGHWELAKDVAAMGNRQEGGYIVLGVATTRMGSAMVEQASAIPLIERTSVDASAYRDVTHSHIYPILRLGPATGWYPPDEGDAGLLAIEVAPQPHSRPFVISTMFGEPSGARGIPVREGDRTVWLPASRIHEHMHVAFLAADGMTSGVGATTGPIEPHRREEMRLELIAEIEKQQEWTDKGVFFLEAIASSELELVDDLEDRILASVESFEHLRKDGFGLRFPPDAEARSSLRLRADTRVLQITTDGAIAGGVATPQFLGWGTTPAMWEAGQPVTINPVALAEFSLEFCRWIQESLIPLVGGEWHVVVSCRRFRATHVSLKPTLEAVAEHRLAGVNELRREIRLQSGPEQTAFRVLEVVYGMFSYGPEWIPWSDRDQHRLLPDSIRELSR